MARTGAPDTQKERDAAQVNLERVIQDYRKRFTGFQPASLRLIRRRLAGSSRHCCLRGCSTGNTFVPPEE